MITFFSTVIDFIIGNIVYNSTESLGATVSAIGLSILNYFMGVFAERNKSNKQ